MTTKKGQLVRFENKVYEVTNAKRWRQVAGTCDSPAVVGTALRNWQTLRFLLVCGEWYRCTSGVLFMSSDENLANSDELALIAGAQPSSDACGFEARRAVRG